MYLFFNILSLLKQRQPIYVIFPTMNTEECQRAPASGSTVYNFCIIKIFNMNNATAGNFMLGLVAMRIHMINNS